jgi:hypothetical protein
MALTVEEWGKLSEAEQTTRQAEKPQELQDDMVIVGGKPRPLRNLLEEVARKTRESVLAEINASKKPELQPKPSVQSDNSDWRRQIASAAEREMEETGSIVPVNTMLDLIGKATGYHMSQFTTNAKNAQKIIKEAKKELRATYKDYSEYEDKFDDLLEGIEPQNVSKEGLKIIFNSLRGENLDAIVAKAREKAAEEAESGKKIVGDIDTGGGSSKSGSKTTLTAEQQQQMKDMGFEDEASYLGRVKHYQEVAKSRNAKNVPTLLAEKLLY